MSGPPRVRSMNFPESESRPVLGPAGNKTRPIDTRKQVSKPQRKAEKPQEIDDDNAKKSPLLSVVNSPPSPSPSPLQQPATATTAAALGHCITVPSILRQQSHRKLLLKSNLSPNASCSSDTSSDSSHSRASAGKISRRSVTPTHIRRKQCGPKLEKVERIVIDTDSGSAASADTSPAKKRCAWVTPNTDPCYAAFHDEEWGVPIHNDKQLFELLVLSIALAELSWPVILNKRHLFREVFLDFDPIAVSKLNEKKTVTPGSTASSLLSELKLRGIIENARQMCKIIDEFGSFDKYIWGFVNHKPIVSQFRYPRQVPIKTSKADAISKDLVRRGFRGVGPTVVYSFMQVAGITNDHLISCFRFQDCTAGDSSNKDSISLKGSRVEDKQHENSTELGLARAIDGVNLSPE
ncbi:putative GMP synthase [glutamine-hydrolyzing] [Camellia lanceoleosa]|uniref:GMP synthase [glutamine-hydrolyzing] n=1 Tax=Camellia lanceoleosa TaxID=1840588 RepID=A0ACC0FB64_9ERIC|nr:putative GMP synthase [glutamine-hydrolyzing] [Camellia lanceoleosa]